MPMEREAYRDNLERLKEQFPDKELLRIGEVPNFNKKAALSSSGKDD